VLDNQAFPLMMARMFTRPAWELIICNALIGACHRNESRRRIRRYGGLVVTNVLPPAVQGGLLVLGETVAALR
jgi:hypothetical protein